MSKFWSPLVSFLTPYIAGEQSSIPDIVKLNTNECPYPPSPQVLAAIRCETDDALRLYPDPNGHNLKQALARNFGLAVDQIFVGNGSDEVLAHVFRALLCHNKPILFPDVTYSFYPVYCGLYGIEFHTIPVTESFAIDLQDYLIPNGGVIFANPNAPTGAAISIDRLEGFLQCNVDSVVVIDEAYVDFGAESAVKLIDRYPNLLVVQTFSKSRSLAGMRIGFALGQHHLIEALERVKNCFNSYPLSRLASAAAIAAVEDTGYLAAVTSKIIAAREALSTDLESLGFEVIPSKANFVFARHPRRDAAQLYKQLRERAILVRHFPLKRTKQFLRITVGTTEQCAHLIAALKTLDCR